MTRSRTLATLAAAVLAGGALFAAPAASSGSAAPHRAQAPALGMAWRGTGTDNLIWWSSFDGGTWSPQQPLTDRRTETAPALGRTGDGQLVMAWRGASGDNLIWWSTYDGSGWSPQQPLTDRRTEASP
ncbi:hypothetical protein ABT261_33035, partial [Amycolatopsis sp. NPDC000740]